MKKQIYFLFIVIGITLVPFIKAQAQYAIPSYDVVLFQANATFEEEQAFNPFITKSDNREERKLVVDVKDDNPNQAVWAIIIAYSMDGLDELGPYTANEGNLLEIDIDEREWGIRVINCSEGCQISVWTE